MSAAEQITAFEADLQKLVSRYRSEFELPYAAAVGVLEMEKNRLCREAEETEE